MVLLLYPAHCPAGLGVDATVGVHQVDPGQNRIVDLVICCGGFLWLNGSGMGRAGWDRMFELEKIMDLLWKHEVGHGVGY